MDGSVNVPGASAADLAAVRQTAENAETNANAAAADAREAKQIAQEAAGKVDRMYVLEITFASAFSGRAYTVTGPDGESYTGTVPTTLKESVGVKNCNSAYTVTCDTSGGDEYSASVTTGPYFGQYSVELSYIDRTLASNTWAQIAQVAAAGTAENYWNVGDEIDIVVDGETLTLQIYGFNHDDLTAGGKAGITFGMKNLMATTRQMNSSNTNAGGFTGSAMYTWLQNTLYPLLPDDLKAVIKAVDKKTSAGSQSSTINTDSMKLFLFSCVETGQRTTTDVYKDEGETYPIFTDNRSRIKNLSNGAGSAGNWWVRSPYTGYSTYFCYIHSTGTDSSNGYASYSNGVCFGFCI